MSLRGILTALTNSGDMVLHHVVTFETRLWPTKMPTRIAYSHSKICDLLRGRKVGCSSLIAKKHGVSGRVANKLWKPLDSTFEKQLVIRPCLLSPLRYRVSDNCQGVLQENLPRRKRTKDVCCMMLLGCGLRKDLNQKGSAIEIIWAWNQIWSVIFDDLNVFC